MSFDVSKVVSDLGDEFIGQLGEPLGLNKDQSVRCARALAARVGMGGEQAVQLAAADAGLSEEVTAAMLQKLVDAGKEKLLADTGVTGAIDNARDQAMAALNNAGQQAAGGIMGKLGGLFGRK